MARRLALAVLAAAAALIVLLSFVGGRVAAVGFAILAVGFPFALMALGAARRGRLGAVAVPIGVTLMLVELSLAGMLAFAGEVVGGPWLGGLPLAAAFQLYGLFLLPLAVIALGFALTFRRFDVADEDLRRLRDLAPKGPA